MDKRMASRQPCPNPSIATRGKARPIVTRFVPRLYGAQVDKRKLVPLQKPFFLIYDKAPQPREEDHLNGPKTNTRLRVGFYLSGDPGCGQSSQI